MRNCNTDKTTKKNTHTHTHRSQPPWWLDLQRPQPCLETRVLQPQPTTKFLYPKHHGQSLCHRWKKNKSLALFVATPVSIGVFIREPLFNSHRRVVGGKSHVYLVLLCHNTHPLPLSLSVSCKSKTNTIVVTVSHITGRVTLTTRR